VTDLKSPRVLYLKGGLFLLLGIAAAALLIVDRPTLKTGCLIVVCVWSFARAYYFAFYVIEHYVDGSYRFAGLFDFVKYAIRTRFGRK
jgi:hypothetical protein